MKCKLKLSKCVSARSLSSNIISGLLVYFNPDSVSKGCFD